MESRVGTMNRYKIILSWSNEDNVFIAEVPELAGCMADGETQQEALENAQIIIQEWIQTATELGHQILQPKERLIDDGTAAKTLREYLEIRELDV